MAITFVGKGTKVTLNQDGTQIDLHGDVATGDLTIWVGADDAQSFIIDGPMAMNHDWGALKLFPHDADPNPIESSVNGKWDTFGSDGTAWWGWKVLTADDVTNGYIVGPYLSGNPASVATSYTFRGIPSGTHYPFWGGNSINSPVVSAFRGAVNTNTTRLWTGGALTPPQDDQLVLAVFHEDALTDPGEHTIDAAWTSGGYDFADTGAATIHLAYDIQTTATEIPVSDVVYGTADNDEYGSGGAFILSDDSVADWDSRAFINDWRYQYIASGTDWTPVRFPDVNEGDSIVIIAATGNTAADITTDPAGYTVETDGEIWDTNQVRVWVYSLDADGTETAPTITADTDTHVHLYIFTVKTATVAEVNTLEETSDVDDTFPTTGVSAVDTDFTIGMAITNDGSAANEFDNISGETMWEVGGAEGAPYNGVQDFKTYVGFYAHEATNADYNPVFEFDSNQGDGGTILINFNFQAVSSGGGGAATQGSAAIIHRAHGRRN